MDENTNDKKPSGLASAPASGWVVMRSDLSGILNSNGKIYVFTTEALADDAARKFSGIAKPKEEAFKILCPPPPPKRLVCDDLGIIQWATRKLKGMRRTKPNDQADQRG